MTTNQEPARLIKARVLAYERKTGLMELAVEHVPSGVDGHITIDFTWLVERCLKWLELNGATIKNCFCFPDQTEESFIFTPSDEMSDEQTSAVDNILRKFVSYTWGPPGTGKTRYVLAQAVNSLVATQKRILIAAPTNLAVDNALDAILQMEFVAPERVLRIGIPSDEFSSRWPSSCEQRAFRQKWEELQNRIAFIERLMNEASELERLSEQLPDRKAQFEVLISKQKSLAAKRTALQATSLSATQALDQAVSARNTSQMAVGEIQKRIDALKMQSIQAAYQALCNQYADLVQEQRAISKTQESIGIWKKMFSTAPEKLKRRQNAIQQQMDVTGIAIKSKQNELSKTDGVARVLQAELLKADTLRSTWDSKCSRYQEELKVIQKQLDDVDAEMQTLDTDSEKCGADLQYLKARHHEISSNSQIPTDDAALIELRDEADSIRRRLEALTIDLESKSILGMTLDAFMGFTMQQAVRFDHVLVDEAAYASLAKVLPLLSLGCPIAFLGDHLQLPAISEARNNHEAESFWKTSAIYLEEVFDPDVGSCHATILTRALEPPRFDRMCKSVLTASYRYGTTLADLLDRHVYHIRLSGRATNNTDIRWIGCNPTVANIPTSRVNSAEVEAIAQSVGAWLQWDEPEKGTLGVLAPYRNQVDELTRVLRRRYGTHQYFELIDILTVHRAQGREWDTVFFSAVDTNGLPGNQRPFLCDTSIPEGRAVVNTAISRAKRYLRIFLDDTFWRDRTHPQSLLTDVVRNMRGHVFEC